VIEYQRPANPRPKISRQFVEQVLAESETTKPPRRRRRKWPEASVADVRAIAQQMEESGPESESEVISSSQVDTETTDDTTDVEVQPVKSQRRSRRKWPEASAEDIRAAAAELMDFEETKPEHFVAEAFITAETNTDSADTDQSEVDEEVASPDDSDTMEEAPLAAKAFEPEADPEEPEDIPVESETEQPGVDHEPTDLTDDHEPADQIDDIAQQHQPTQDEVEDEQQKSRDEWWRKQRGEE
jgi:hypothetical protein